MRTESKVLVIRSLLLLLVITVVSGIFIFPIFHLTEWRIPMTIILMISTCIGVLCNSLLFGTRYRAIGVVGTVASALGGISLLIPLWWGYSDSVLYKIVDEPLQNISAATVTLSFAFMITSLLLHVTRERTLFVNKMLWITIWCILATEAIVLIGIVFDLGFKGREVLSVLGAIPVLLATVGTIGILITTVINKGKQRQSGNRTLESDEEQVHVAPTD